MCGLEQAGEAFADAAHRLGVGGVHADGAEVVEDVFGGHGLRPDAAVGEGDVFTDIGVEMVAHHEHVHVLGERVDGEGAGGVGGRGKDVGFTGEANDVGRVPAAGPFGVIGVNGPSGDGGDGRFGEAGLVESVGVNRDLDVEFVGDTEGGIDGGGRGAPIFVQFESAGARQDLFAQRPRIGRVAFGQQAPVNGQRFGSLQHAADVPWAGCGGGGARSIGGARSHRRAWW